MGKILKVDLKEFNEILAEFDKSVMDKMIKQYGEKRGKAVYYATANKQGRDPETFEKKD
jgi:hypothetical protein